MEVGILLCGSSVLGFGGENATQKKVLSLLEMTGKYVRLYIGKLYSDNKMAMKQNIYQETNILRDVETGQVDTVEHTNIVKLPNEPPYIKLYLDDIQKLYNLPNNTILYELLKRMNFDGEIVLNASEKKKIAAVLDIKIQTIDNYLVKLKAADIFTSEDKGTYVPNPNLFGKGDWLTILSRRKTYGKKQDKSINMSITYGEDGSKTVKTQFTGTGDENV